MKDIDSISCAATCHKCNHNFIVQNDRHLDETKKIYIYLIFNRLVNFNDEAPVRTGYSDVSVEIQL